MRSWRLAASGRLILLGLAAAAAAAAPAPAQPVTLTQAELVRSLLPTVVNISARAEISDSPDPVLASANAKASQSSAIYSVRTSAGSGFVIDASGQIATNWHVVDGAFEIFVTFADGTRAKAELLNASPLVDLAVIKVSAGHRLPAVKWADSHTVQVGDPVLAIGNPLGVGMSVSGGLVSALNRNIMDTPYDDFIQTDAAINHGNSGGPLFNLKGEVIGVNSAIISPTSGSAGLGFAMPSNDARFIFDRLTHKEFRRPGYLGAKLQPVTPEMALAMGLDAPRGSIVAALVNPGPASRAGLRVGDVVVHFGKDEPSDERALLRAIARAEPGSSVTLGVLRQGRETELPVTIEEWPTMWWEDVAAAAAARPHLNIPADLGLTVEPLTDQLRASYEVLPDAAGLIVTGVLPGTDAAQRGLGPGDVIHQIGDTQLATQADLQHAIDKAREDKRPYVMVLVMRKSQPVTPAQLPGPKWMTLRLAAG